MTASYNHGYICVNNHGCFTFENHGCIFQGMNFNERLKWAREEAGLTQKQLVDSLPKKPDGKAMMSQANLAKMEKNEKTVGSNYSYFIAIACGVSPDWLINESGEPKGLTVCYTSEQPEYKVLTLMQVMDPPTKARAARLISSLVDPTDET